MRGVDRIDRQLLAGGIEAGRARLHRQQRALAGAVEPDVMQPPWRTGRLQRLGDPERLQGRVAADQRLDQRAGGRAQVLQALVELRGEVVGIQRLRSEEHTSELQSLMRISYAVFCLKKKTHPAYTSYKTIPTNTNYYRLHHLN